MCRACLSGMLRLASLRTYNVDGRACQGCYVWRACAPTTWMGRQVGKVIYRVRPSIGVRLAVVTGIIRHKPIEHLDAVGLVGLHTRSLSGTGALGVSDHVEIGR